MTASQITPLSATVSETTDNHNNDKKKRLVLVGGGHSHLQVIKALNHASRPKNLEVTLVDLTDHPCYSGMVPSAVAGIYSPQETFVQLKSLAEWSRIDFVQDRVVDIDLDTKTVITREDQTISFDAISIDIGSTSRGLNEIPGARDYTIPTRPISELIRRIETATDILKSSNTANANVLVVGGGAAGIELSMAILGRWKPILGEENIHVTLLNSMDELLPDETLANRRALRERLEERGISVIHNAKVDRVDPETLILDSGEHIEFTHCIWATGAESHSDLSFSLRGRGLAVSQHGWIQVNESFQSLSHPFLFAAGDCCTMKIPGGSPPKAGVYAVRAGPILIENLTRFLVPTDATTNESDNNCSEPSNEDCSSTLTKYAPQKDFLKLLACGDGKALGFRFGIPIYGKWVFELKDAIDRSFMELFQKEYLPELVEGQPYDTSQYDASSNRPPPMDSRKAAVLLGRSDDDVDFQTAWNVIRDMAEDDAYREEVLEHIEVGAASANAIAEV